MPVFNVVLIILGLIKRLGAWFRDRSIFNSGRNVERGKIVGAEGKARDAMDKVERDTPAALINRLRDGGF